MLIGGSPRATGIRGQECSSVCSHVGRVMPRDVDENGESGTRRIRTAHTTDHAGSLPAARVAKPPPSPAIVSDRPGSDFRGELSRGGASRGRQRAAAGRVRVCSPEPLRRPAGSVACRCAWTGAAPVAKHQRDLLVRACGWRRRSAERAIRSPKSYMSRARRNLRATCGSVTAQVCGPTTRYGWHDMTRTRSGRVSRCR